MASLGLVEADYAWVSKQLMQVARTHCKGRIVSMLEGGYALSALGRSVAEHVGAGRARLKSDSRFRQDSRKAGTVPA
jgi:acetoin utilization deacetylase AcuC-like enzyme